MANEELLKTLDKLHQELSQNPTLDETSLRSMRAILDEIQTAISRIESDKTAASSERLTITQRLQDLISVFEARHPQLTATLSQIADRLTDMGI